MASKEQLICEIVSAVLAVSPLTAGDIRTHDTDTDTVSLPSRIVVKCEPPIPHISGKNPAETPGVWEAMVMVTVIGAQDKTAAQFDAWIAAVDTNLSGTPSAAVTLATTNFPLGFVLDVSTQGNRWDDQVEQRRRSRSFRVIFR